MKKKLLVVIIIFLYSCNGYLNDCGEVYTKYEKDGEYFLVINLSNQRPNNGEDPGGEILADAKVNKTTYDSKKIGDEFCFEN